jgi:hypothetical protein
MPLHSTPRSGDTVVHGAVAYGSFVSTREGHTQRFGRAAMLGDKGVEPVGVTTLTDLAWLSVAVAESARRESERGR